MPMYEYACTKCGERFEIIQKFSDAPLRLHSEEGGRNCDGQVKKLLSAPAIRFKGSGWYVTDYGKGGKKPADGKDKAAKETKAGSADKTGSDSASKADSSKKNGSGKTASSSAGSSA